MSPEMSHADDLPELPDPPDEAHGTSAAAAAAARPGEPPPLRALDQAPRHLRVAALVVVLGSFLQWMPGEVAEPSSKAWLMTLLAKVVIGAAAWLWYQQVLHDFGPARTGVLGQLANLSLIPKKKQEEDDGKTRRPKPRQQQMHLEHPFPTGLHLLAILLAGASLFIAAKDPRKGLAGTSSGIPEVAMLGWAAFTWVHIAGYERWRAFNPLFPLMFLGMLFAGAMAVIRAFGSEAGGLAKLMGILGGGAVAVGGGLAAYTIAEAMMQAKKEGDRKKAEALEARKAARKKKE